MAKNKDIESLYQRELLTWCRLAVDGLLEGYPVIPELARIFAIPNGGKRDKGTAIKMKAEGVRAGVLDLFLPVVRGGYAGLWIEMKSGIGSTSIEQDKEIPLLRKEGYRVVVCDSPSKAWYAIVEYLAGKTVPVHSDQKFVENPRPY